MAIKTETNAAAEFLASEAPGTRSREVVTLASGQDLQAGTVLGRKLPTAATSVGAAGAGNTGDGTIGTITEDSQAKEGVYRITCIEPATDGGTFVVEDPDGIEIGTAVVGSAFDGDGINFTISDGATDFAAGDFFTITVAGDEEYSQHDMDATDGLEVARAILLADVDASAAAKSAVVIARDAEVVKDSLIWQSDIDAAEKVTALAELANVGIIGR